MTGYDAVEADAAIEEAIKYIKRAIDEIEYLDSCEWELKDLHTVINDLNRKREELEEECIKCAEEDRKTLEDEYNRMRI